MGAEPVQTRREIAGEGGVGKGGPGRQAVSDGEAPRQGPCAREVEVASQVCEVGRGQGLAEK